MIFCGFYSIELFSNSYPENVFELFIIKDVLGRLSRRPKDDVTFLDR